MSGEKNRGTVFAGTGNGAENGRGQTRRSGIRIMGQLIGLVKPLFPVMLLAIVLGTAGYLCAIVLTIQA